jgi:cytochrome c oxidase subunit 4
MSPVLRFAVAWLVLLALVGVTCGSAYVPIGAAAHAVLPIGVAVLQAAIIAIVYMKLGSGGRVKWIFAGIGFYWLMIMIGLSATDYLTRSGFPMGR